MHHRALRMGGIYVVYVFPTVNRLLVALAGQANTSSQLRVDAMMLCWYCCAHVTITQSKQGSRHIYTYCDKCL